MALRRILPFALLPLSYAATVTYDFNISWVTANPDGLQSRSVIGINGQWPIPYIEVTKGDRVIVNLNNQLKNESTSLHFHGIYMNGTTNMDGSAGVSQCPVPPGSSFQYNFTVRAAIEFSNLDIDAHKDRSTGHLLVPFSCKFAIPRWPPWPANCA